MFGQLVFDGFSMGLVYVILATGLVLIASVDQILFFAYGQFFTLGAYATWFAAVGLNLPFPLALLFGVLVSALIGLISYLLIFQRLQFTREKFLATLIASMGLSLIISQAGTFVYGTTPRRIPQVFYGKVTFLDITMGVDKIALIILGLAATLLLFWVYQKTNVGRAMRAIASKPNIAMLYGVNANRLYMITLAVGTGLAGFAGGIIAPVYGIKLSMGQDVLWTVMLMGMLGGMDSLLGAVAGGLVIGQLLSFGQFYLGGIIQTIIFLVIGVVLYFRPQGLLGKGLDIGM
ncbi:MAG: branched-chain amino acid ABC transporter permease [Dehalococcoidales bacterium]|nr:branched-chain amino acid ABC transporter permease [Dehalococcoidales bacterium]